MRISDWSSDVCSSDLPYYDTMAVTIVDDNAIREVDKKAGKIISDSTMTVAADGKTANLEVTDSSNNITDPITGTGTKMRVAKGPAGPHEAAGSWRPPSHRPEGHNTEPQQQMRH